MARQTWFVAILWAALSASSSALLADKYRQGRLGTSITVALKRRVLRSASTSRLGSLKAHADTKLAYYGTINVGTPGQPFTVVFDTGHCWQDVVCIQGICSHGSFVVSTRESNNPFLEFGFDGVLGLARPELARSDEFSVMSRLIGQGVLKQPVFTFFLSDSEDAASEVTFGQINHEHAASGFFWAPLSGRSGYWEIQVQDITFNGENQELCKDCKAAVDTGMSYITGPSGIVEKLEQAIGLRSDCSNFNYLPRLGFRIQGRILNLLPRDFVETGGMVYCSLSLIKLDVPPPKGPLLVFGLPFLTRYYTVFDAENGQLGFAESKHPGASAGLLQVPAGAPSQEGNPLPNMHPGGRVSRTRLSSE